ncbi:MAG: HEAT repeat domain-containing protein [Bdellovibrionota bacterium]
MRLKPLLLKIILASATCIFSNTKLFALDALKEAEDNRDPHSAALFQATHSTHPQERARAARALGRIQQAAAVDPLLLLLEDSNISVQNEAIFALGQYAWAKSFSNGREEEISQKIAKKLTSKSNSVIRFAIEALGKIALLKTPKYTLPFLKNPNPELRAEAILSLYRYRLIMRLRDPNTEPPLLSDETVNILASLSKDPSSLVREKLAYYFMRVKDTRGLKALLELSKDKNTWTRFYAVNALGKYASQESLEQLQRATSDLDDKIRTAAIQGISTLKEVHLLDHSLRGDPSFHVRMAYAQALGTAQDDPEAVEKLKELMLDSRISVRAEALKAFSAHSPPKLSLHLEQELKSKSWVIRSAATESTQYLEEGERKKLLLIALTDKDKRVRVSALEILATIEETFAYDALKKALQSEELSERGTAASALKNRKESDRLELSFNCYKNSLSEKWTELREELVGLWASEVSHETNEYLKEATRDPNSSVARLAAQVLEERDVHDFPTPNTQEKLSYSPYRSLSFKRNPMLYFKTTKGEVKIELFPREAPIHVANIVGFAEDKKYNGLPIHRVVSNFVVQGGDPDKTGWGSAGYSLRAEINPLNFQRGCLGMPRSTGFDTGGVQFFINHIPTPHLDGQYTVFGKVVNGLEIIDQLEVGDLILESRVQR